MPDRQALLAMPGSQALPCDRMSGGVDRGAIPFMLAFIIGQGQALTKEGELAAWAAVAISLAVAVPIVIYTGFWKQWTFGRYPVRVRGGALLGNTLLSLAVLSSLFAQLLAALVVSDAVEVKPPVPDARAIDTALAACWWHLLDTIPALDGPSTLNWEELSHRFTDQWGGAVLLAYRAAVVIPVISAVTIAITRRREPRATAPTAPNESLDQGEQ
jgi:hypothetical protein